MILISDLKKLGLMAVIAFCAGFFINRIQARPLPLLYKTKTEVLEEALKQMSMSSASLDSQKSSLSPKYLTIDEFSEFVNNKRGLIIDARPRIFHRVGHVPGAVNLPRNDFENGYGGLKHALEKDRKQAIVLYCSDSSCQDGDLVRRALAQLGYSNTAVFKGGWAEWVKSGKPVENTR